MFPDVAILKSFSLPYRPTEICNLAKAIPVPGITFHNRLKLFSGFALTQYPVIASFTESRFYTLQLSL
jgi:hypothetical protein